jgi:hypothetical protein
VSLACSDRGSLLGEKDLRRQIDKCVSQALVDADYAKALLSDPTTVLGDRDCPPQQYLSLRSINASTLLEFAQQARELFWAVDPFAPKHGRSWRPSLINQQPRPLTASAHW